MKYLQKLGKALMLPVSCMPVCGLLMGLGYCLCPAAMQGGEVTGIIAEIGYFLIRAGGRDDGAGAGGKSTLFQCRHQ